jgi:hypothetical protein
MTLDQIQPDGPPISVLATARAPAMSLALLLARWKAQVSRVSVSFKTL